MLEWNKYLNTNKQFLQSSTETEFCHTIADLDITSQDPSLSSLLDVSVLLCRDEAKSTGLICEESWERFKRILDAFVTAHQKYAAPHVSSVDAGCPLPESWGAKVHRIAFLWFQSVAHGQSTPTQRNALIQSLVAYQTAREGMFDIARNKGIVM